MKPDHTDQSFLVDNQYSIKDLVDTDRLRRLFELFAQATGLTVIFLDHPGMNLLAASGERDICVRFHKNRMSVLGSCDRSIKHLISQLNESGQPVIEECENGLVECAIPFIIQGKHVASLVAGQLLLQQPDVERFKQQAGLNGFDEAAYLKALSEVSVIDGGKLRSVTAFLGEMAGTISSMGYDRMIALKEARQTAIEAAELRESEKKYRKLFMNAPTAFYEVDYKSRRFLIFNEIIPAITGYSRDELMQMNPWDLFTEESRKIYIERIKQMMEAREVSVSQEYSIRKKDGGILWIDTSVDYTIENGQPVKGLVVAHDITGRKQMEEALRISEEKYRGILDNIDDSYYEVDLKGNYIFFNEAMVVATGYSRDELMHMNYKQVISPDAHQLVKEIFSELFRTGKPVRLFDYDFNRKDGARRNLETWAAPVFDQNSRVIGFKGMARDVTDRKVAEEALRISEERLRRSEERYRVILENMEEAYYEVDLKGNYTFFNSSTVRNLGYSREELMGMNYRLYVDEEDIQTVFDAYRKVLSTGEAIKGIDWTCITKEGKKIPVEGSVSLIRDEDGKPAGFRGVLRDITQRREAEKELRESEEKYRLLAESAMIGIFWINNAFQFIYGNDQLCRILGCSRSELIGRNFRDILTKNSVELVSDRYIRRQRGEDVPDRYEIEIIRPDGEVRNVEMMVVVMLDKSGKMNSIGQAIDITERRREEIERERLKEQLAQAQKMESVGRLAGGVAHDFNNMLSVIIGNAELSLKNENLFEPLRKSLENILQAGKRSADLTRQLLAFARKQTVNPRVIDLNGTVAGMLNMLHRLIGENIDLRWHPGHSVWKVRIDPSQVDQMLANLVVNARDAIEKSGNITIETSNRRCDKFYCMDRPEWIPGDYAVLAVSDDGCGMDREIVANIFEPFFTTKEEGHGTGLGLATVYGIIKQNNGYVNVYSEKGKGTTFRIYLPRQVDEKMESNLDQPETKLEGGGETILIVEDEETVLNISKTILETLGYRVLSARGREQALGIVREYDGSIDLLLTDVVMPGINGKDLAEQILDLKPGLKCLFMSGYTADVIARQGVLEQGMKFISKPFSLSELAVKVREALEK